MFLLYTVKLVFSQLTMLDHVATMCHHAVSNWGHQKLNDDIRRIDNLHELLCVLMHTTATVYCNGAEHCGQLICRCFNRLAPPYLAADCNIISLVPGLVGDIWDLPPRGSCTFQDPGQWHSEQGHSRSLVPQSRMIFLYRSFFEQGLVKKIAENMKDDCYIVHLPREMF